VPKTFGQNGRRRHDRPGECTATGFIDAGNASDA
jgi:hypothetical protein